MIKAQHNNVEKVKKDVEEQVDYNKPYTHLNPKNENNYLYDVVERHVVARKKNYKGIQAKSLRSLSMNLEMSVNS